MQNGEERRQGLHDLVGIRADVGIARLDLAERGSYRISVGSCRAQKLHPRRG